MPKSNQKCVCVCTRLNSIVQLVKCGINEQNLSDMREKIKRLGDRMRSVIDVGGIKNECCCGYP